MSQEQPKLNVGQPIVLDDGTMDQVFREWTQRLSNVVPIVRTGSPEGAIEAPQYSLYIDDTVPAVPVTYRKMLPEIGGDRSMGWVVV
jgi:hypothetical protein